MNFSDINALTGSPLVRASVNTASFNGPALDLIGYLGTIKASQHVGAVAGTNATLDTKIQDSADGVTFADVAGLAFAQVTTANNDQSIQIDTRAVRRYVRTASTIGGTNSPSFTFNVGAIGCRRSI